MFIHPHLREARPLMVVGGPRCGTRFVANALNRNPTVFVQGEVPPRAMEQAVRFLSATAEYFASVPQWAVSWQQNRRALLYALWMSMVKGKTPALDSPLNWFGHKTPRHDQYWEFYRDFLSDVRPKYVFCMRNFLDHYLSMNSMNGHSIDVVAAKYRASVGRYAKMKAALGDDVSLFILDDLSAGGVDYIRETLFERLGRVDTSRRANSTEGAGRSRRKELTAEERAFLDRNDDLLEALQALRAARPLVRTVESTAPWKGWLSQRRDGARRWLAWTSTWSRL
jgi:Sulfotransferase family